MQARRPSLFDLEEKLKQLSVPTLILNGDEDDPCLTPGVYLKRMIRSSALITLANSGHTINLESTEDFNRAVDQFLTQVHSGQWPVRLVSNKEGSSILGMKNGES